MTVKHHNGYGIGAKAKLLLSHFQSREFQRCDKQAGGYMSPGHHVIYVDKPRQASTMNLTGHYTEQLNTSKVLQVEHYEQAFNEERTPKKTTKNM